MIDITNTRRYFQKTTNFEIKDKRLRIIFNYGILLKEIWELNNKTKLYKHNDLYEEIYKLMLEMFGKYDVVCFDEYQFKLKEYVNKYEDDILESLEDDLRKIKHITGIHCREKFKFEDVERKRKIVDDHYDFNKKDYSNHL